MSQHDTQVPRQAMRQYMGNTSYQLITGTTAAKIEKGKLEGSHTSPVYLYSAVLLQTVQSRSCGVWVMLLLVLEGEQTRFEGVQWFR